MLENIYVIILITYLLSKTQYQQPKNHNPFSQVSSLPTTYNMIRLPAFVFSCVLIAIAQHGYRISKSQCFYIIFFIDILYQQGKSSKFFFIDI